jgi:hypothetical protein
MPLDIHVYDGKKTPDSQDGQERYADDPNKTGQTGQGNFTNAQRDALGNYTANASLRYADPNAYFCTACWYVFGVTCPKCSARSAPAHLRPVVDDQDDPLFEVIRPGVYEKVRGSVWAVVMCRKCSFSFRVLKR